MNRIHVESSNIVSMGYDPDEQILEVEFKNGVYQYIGVKPDVHQAMIEADSKGKYFTSVIKPNYLYHKV